MSARERLTEALRNPGLVGYDEDGATELVDAFARELAEEIRSERDDANIPGSPATPDVIAGMSYAANLIDPQGHEGERPDGSEEKSA